MRVSRPLIAASLVAAVGVAAAATQVVAMQQVEQRLAGAGLTWSARAAVVGRAVWSDLRARGVSVDRVTLSLLPTPSLSVDGVRVELSQVSLPGGASEAGDPAAAPAAVPVRVSGVDLSLDGTPLFTGLSGTVRPQLLLQSAQGRVQRSPTGGVQARLEREVSLGPVSGAATVSLDCASLEACTATARMDEATFADPLLAPGPLDPVPVRLEAQVAPLARTAQGSARVGAAPLTFRLDADRTLHLEAEDIPLSAILEPFAPYVREARYADVGGTVGGTATVDLVRGRVVALAPTARGLTARGVLRDPDALAFGSVTWRAPLEGGEWVPKTTGRGWPGWTPLQDAGLVPEAMVAAEDAAFWTHGGVHLPAIVEAVESSLEDPEAPLRGGSTITQQLAKNLFCDPNDRTMARKLTELLYALELEAVLPKQRILELYINIVELGPELYGVGPAADAYFIKRPARMTPAEAAFLASILPAPRTWYRRSLTGNPPRAKMEFILDNMANGGTLTKAEAARAKATPPRIVPLARP